MHYPPLNVSKTILIIVVSLSMTAITIPRVAHADASNPTSTLAIGDWWKYNVQTPIGGLILTGSQTITLVYQANSTGTLWTGRSSASGTLAGSVAGSRVTGTWVQGGWGQMRKSDLADVDSRFTLNLTIVGSFASATIYFTFTSYNTPPVLQFQFPLSVGSSWSMSGGNNTVLSSYYSSVDPTVHSSSNVTTTNAVYNVLSSPLTTVEAGTFDSYQIRQRNPDGTYTDSYYSPETEELVKQLGFAANGTQESSMTLTDYGAWPYKSTIGLSMNGNNYNAVIGTDVSATNIHQDGRSIIFTVTGTDTVTGKASVWIPVQANNTMIKVLVDSTPVTVTASSNQTFYQIVFSFPLSTHTVTVTYAAAPSFLVQYLLPITVGIVVVVAAIIITTLLLVRRRARQPQPPPLFWQPQPPAPTPPAETPPPSPPALH